MLAARTYLQALAAAKLRRLKLLDGGIVHHFCSLCIGILIIILLECCERVDWISDPLLLGHSRLLPSSLWRGAFVSPVHDSHRQTAQPYFPY